MTSRSLNRSINLFRSQCPLYRQNLIQQIQRYFFKGKQINGKHKADISKDLFSLSTRGRMLSFRWSTRLSFDTVFTKYLTKCFHFPQIFVTLSEIKVLCQPESNKSLIFIYYLIIFGVSYECFLRL